MADCPQMPLLPTTSQATLRGCASLSVNSKNVFICSYPKSGTTWMQNIVYTLATNGRELDHISKYAPFFESDRSWSHTDDGSEIAEIHRICHREIGWRIFNTHLYWTMMPRNGDARYIYVVRNGKDVCNSYYHHFTHMTIEDGGTDLSFDDYFQEWIKGNLTYGKWTDHLKSWMEAFDDPRVLVVSYESLKSDLRSALLAINAHCNFGLSEADIDILIPRFSFKYMKENVHKFNPIFFKWVDKGDGFEFVRKGVVGDHRTIFTEEHSKLFDEMVKESFPHGIPNALSTYPYLFN